jgi:hypothetical protein
MASGSSRCFLSDEELLFAVNNLESEEEYSEFGDFDSEYYPTDNEDSDSAAIDEAAPQPSRKRNRSNPPLFQWHSGAFKPVIHAFDDSASGISTNEIQDEPTALDIFRCFFSQEIMQEIASETNKYYQFVTDKIPPSTGSRLQKWGHTTVEELYVFLAVTMLMVRTKKLTILEYWSTDPLLATPQFSDFMSRDRYLLLLRLLHFRDKNPCEGDRLYKQNKTHHPPSQNKIHSSFYSISISLH